MFRLFWISKMCALNFDIVILFLSLPPPGGQWPFSICLSESHFGSKLEINIYKKWTSSLHLHTPHECFVWIPIFRIKMAFFCLSLAFNYAVFAIHQYTTHSPIFVNTLTLTLTTGTHTHTGNCIVSIYTSFKQLPTLSCSVLFVRTV